MRHLKLLSMIGLVGMLAVGGGCSGLGQLVGGMAENAHRSGSNDVKAKYTGLQGKSFAVVVAADRSIQGDQPEIVPLLTREIVKRLSDNAGAAGVVPAEDILLFQYQRPGWVAMSPLELAKTLEVQRLVYIDLHDFSLTEPGNPYVWDGNASASVDVLEADGKTPDDFVFTKALRVKFPDHEGTTPMEISRQLVGTELAVRLIHRVSWLFYDHDESNDIKY